MVVLLPDPLSKEHAKPLKRRFRGCHRLRVDCWRVIYRVDQRHKTIAIVLVGHRDTVYDK